MRVASLRELAQDPSSPYWMRDLIPELERKDPVDVLNGLEAIANAIRGPVHVTPRKALERWAATIRNVAANYQMDSGAVVRLVTIAHEIDAVRATRGEDY